MISLWSFSCRQAGGTECNRYQGSHKELSLSHSPKHISIAPQPWPASSAPRLSPVPQSPAPQPPPAPRSPAPVSYSKGEMITPCEYLSWMAARPERDQSLGTDNTERRARRRGSGQVLHKGIVCSITVSCAPAACSASVSCAPAISSVQVSGPR